MLLTFLLKPTFIALILFFVFTGTTSAATLVVTNTNDSGAGSLRGQIAAAASGDTIVFTGIPANSTIALTSGQIVFPGGTNIVIDGTASTLITITASAGNRIFHMPNNGSRNIVLSNLWLTGGSISTNSATGGAISFESGGSLTLNGCSIVGNTLSGNNTRGGGIYLANAGGTLSMTNTTVSGNTISGTTAEGGGVWIGGVSSFVNSTISGNTTNANNSDGAGIFINSSVSSIVMNHVTITLNTSNGNGNNDGGGIRSSSGGALGTIRNTIIAGNAASGTGPDVSGVFATGGYNLIGIGNGATGFVNGISEDQVGTTGTPINSLLFPLANNGGSSFTHALMMSSPARDKATATGGATTDQRSFPRPYDDVLILNAPGGNGSDIGSFEAQTHSAAGVSVSGRVTDANGNGIYRVQVTIVGAELSRPSSAITNAFGYYTIDDLEVGSTYVVSVAAKGRSFADPTRIISLTDVATNVDFVAITEPFRSLRK